MTIDQRFSEITHRRVHVFASTSEGYDETQCSDDVRDGDILLVPSEGVAGFMAEAWPTAATKEHGHFHRIADTDVARAFHAEGLAVARAVWAAYRAAEPADVAPLVLGDCVRDRTEGDTGFVESVDAGRVTVLWEDSGAVTTVDRARLDYMPEVSGRVLVDGPAAVHLGGVDDEQDDDVSFLCDGCDVDTFDIAEYFMVRNELWEQAGNADMLCVGCTEDRLGRQLTRADFIDAPVNWSADWERSERLESRLLNGAVRPGMYAVGIKHERGTLVIATFADSIDTAMSVVCTAESAPRSAVLSVEYLGATAIETGGN